MNLIHCGHLNLVYHKSDSSLPYGYAYEKRTLQTYEFDYVLSSDQGVICTDGQATLLSPGMFFVRTPGMTVQGFTHYHSWYLTFETENAFSFSRPYYFLPTVLCNPIFQTLYDLHIQRPSDAAYLIDYYMNQLLFHLYQEELRLSSQEKPHKSLDWVRQNMENSWNKNLPLDYYVRLSGYSKSRFCHLFQELYQISPIQFLHRLRLQHLCYQLIETDSPVKELMIEHGFINEQSFFRAFKRYTGDTPMEYRRKHRMK